MVPLAASDTNCNHCCCLLCLSCVVCLLWLLTWLCIFELLGMGAMLLVGHRGQGQLWACFLLRCCGLSALMHGIGVPVLLIFYANMAAPMHTHDIPSHCFTSLLMRVW